ncbi:MAG: DUF3613 domain-containing protein [Comamonadaceae bacterium]|nr:MAG: DUF3613 domain-containing protein [Comamonadaceae bacterium]
MNKDTLTMHDASTRKFELHHIDALAWATVGLALGLMALPAAGQGAPPSAASSMRDNRVAPVVVSSEAGTPAGAQQQAPLPVAQADIAQPTTAEAEETQAPYFATVGDATRNLLDLQRSGQIASPVARPVPGEIAQRSRERYLKSFEREIPEWFQSSVSEKSTSK